MKVRIAGVAPGSELAAELIQRFMPQITHYQRSQHQKADLAGLNFYSAHTELPQLKMQYTRNFGNERMDIEVAPGVLQGEVKKQHVKHERDLVLGGYICIHNWNNPPGNPVGTEPEGEAAHPAHTVWINGNAVGSFSTVGQGGGGIIFIGGYRDTYHSIHSSANASVILPGHPEGDYWSRKRYYHQRVMLRGDVNEFADFHVAVDGPLGQEIEGTSLGGGGIDIPLSYINPLGSNEVLITDNGPSTTEEYTVNGVVYAEFFARYVREVEVSWNYSFAKLADGSPRKILVNDDPVMFAGTYGRANWNDPEFPNLHTDPDGQAGAFIIDLTPPGGGGIDSSDIWPINRRSHYESVPEGYRGWLDPWPLFVEGDGA